MGKSEDLLTKARALLDQERFKDALKITKEAIELAPENVQAWLLKGNILGELKKYEAALKSYDRAIEVNPRYEMSWIRKGHVLEKLERYEEALQSYDRAIEVNPKDHWGWIGKGDVLETLKRYEEALQSYDRAIEVNPEEGISWFRKGFLLAALGRLPDALSCFNRALELFHAEADADWESLAESWVQALQNRIAEERARKEPTAEVKILRSVRERLQKNPDDDPYRIMKDHERQYEHYFRRPRTVQPEDRFFVVLRRWNSFTPRIPNRPAAKGGGYFLVWRGKGIVIDPGFDFMDNFDGAGYSIQDIDAVVLTHAHTDHTADLETLLCLKHEQSERLHDNSSIDLFMNRGTLHKFIGWISRLGVVGKVVSLNAGDSIEPEGYHLVLKAMDAKHSEIIGRNCLGLVFELQEGSKGALKLGITSDTGWSGKIQRQYKGCKLLCLHLGSIGPNEFKWSLPLRSKKRLYGEHLGLIGTISMVKSVRPYLSIISEFGEELGSERHHIASALDLAFGPDRRCLTGDIGLKVRLPDLSVYCDVCREYKECSLITETPVKKNESIIYYCSTHTPEQLINRPVM